jgi:hypothetical protein
MMKCMPVIILSAVLVGCSGSRTVTETAGGQSKAASSEQLTDAGYKRYHIESGLVEYELSGARKGSETLYFDQWGMREAKYTNAELTLMGISQKENKLGLMDGEWIYAIDLDRKTGTKRKNPLLKDIAEKSGTKDFTELGERMMSHLGEKIGAGEVAGKMCDIWEVKDVGTKSWVWKGVTLKVQTRMAGMEMTMTAIGVEEGASIPDDKFAIPAGVTITEGAEVKDMLQRIKPGKKT